MPWWTYLGDPATAGRPGPPRAPARARSLPAATGSVRPGRPGTSAPPGRPGPREAQRPQRRSRPLVRADPTGWHRGPAPRPWLDSFRDGTTAGPNSSGRPPTRLVPEDYTSLSRLPREAG